MTAAVTPDVLPQGVEISVDEVARAAIFLGRSRVATLATRLYAEPGVGPAEVAATISEYPHIAERLINVANTVRHGAGISATSLEAATVRLGSDRTKAMAVAFEAGRILHTLYADTIDFGTFWRKCLVRGCVARAVAMNCQPALAGHALLTGIMQDIGIPALAEFDREAYRELLNSSGGSQIRLAIAEWQTYRINHVHVGMKIATAWRLSPQVTESLGRHHTNPPLGRIAEPRARLWQIGYFVGSLPLDGAADATEAAPLLRILESAFGISGRGVGTLLAQAAEEYDDVARFFEEYMPRTTSAAEVLRGTADALGVLARREGEAFSDSLSGPVLQRSDRDRALQGAAMLSKATA